MFKDITDAVTDEFKNIKIILSSSWRQDTDQFGNKSADGTFRNELKASLATVNLCYHDETPQIEPHRRGLEIVTYLASLDEIPDGFVILDDICFADFSVCHVMRHLVQTDRYLGLTAKHKRNVIKILKSGLTPKEIAFINLIKQKT